MALREKTGRWREEKPLSLHWKNKGSRAVRRSHQGIGHGEKTLGNAGEGGRKESERKACRPAVSGPAEASACALCGSSRRRAGAGWRGGEGKDSVTVSDLQ